MLTLDLPATLGLTPTVPSRKKIELKSVPNTYGHFSSLDGTSQKKFLFEFLEHPTRQQLDEELLRGGRGGGCLPTLGILPPTSSTPVRHQSLPTDS